MAEPDITQIKDTTANPAPLGLLAFGMTTVLLNLHNAGFYELNAMILGMGLFGVVPSGAMSKDASRTRAAGRAGSREALETECILRRDRT